MTDSGNLAMLGRAMGGLIVVLVLIGLVARVTRRARGHKGTTGLRVIDRVGLSREANLAVVEVANRVLLLGVTAHGVTMLADLDSATPPEPDEAEDGPRGPEPAFAVPIRPPADTEPRAQRRPVPTGVALDEYPDLASALRAAGRTADAPAAGAIDAQASSTPRTRAEARAEARARASISSEIIPISAQDRPSPSASTEVDRIPAPRRATGTSATSRVVPGPARQASGSVLSPRTWRQGIEALRDLTVRRG
jgi:flagellar biogenesis protein FliO